MNSSYNLSKLPSGVPLWHYTTAECFVQIKKSGAIRPATAFVPERERPIVWFSSNQLWEQSANKGIWENGVNRTLSMEQTRDLGGGLVRIGVSNETAPHNWWALKRLSGMAARTAKGLEPAALRCNANPKEWFGTFDAVPAEKWVAVQRLHDDGQWLEATQMNGVDKNDVRPNAIAEMCSPAFLQDVKQAEIIFGADEETTNKFIVFGKSLLEDIASGTESRTARTLTVPILQRTDELECLLAAVRLVKGHHDYTPSGH